jgi:Tfp pilus assembly PilM family ATPase
MRERSLPLGVDLGASRVRVAAASTTAEGRTRLLATGAADVVVDPREALRLALGQLPTLERRCIAAVRTCDARLRLIRFPGMGATELRRAVRFEGVSMFGGSVDEETIAVRSATIGEDTIVAATPARKVRETIDVLTACGLRVVTVDHEACVLTRAAQLPLLDIGLERSTLIALANGLPLVRAFSLGGAFFSDALAHEFGTSLQIAEIRKRTIGLGGAADHALDAYVRALGVELEGLDARAFQALFVCGNGARLSALREKIADAFSIRVVPVDLGTLMESDLPPELEHNGAFDWFGAVALALPALAASAA